VPRPRLYVAALSHLDTQWRWSVEETVRRFLPATVDENDALFDRHPGWILSFEGAYRYRLLEEYHPSRFEVVRRRVAEGRWFPAGAAHEAFDALLPSPESLLRQIVHGTRWLEARLGRAGRDLLLADSFGFPAILPTLAVHAGLIGFSTQKLQKNGRVRSAFGIPFGFGRWRGPDGSELLAALDLDGYTNRLAPDAGSDPAWRERFERLAASGGGDRLLHFVGVGDKGGGLPEEMVAELERAAAAAGEIEIVHGTSERIFAETEPAARAKLPAWEGELLMTLHATGCYTAKGAMKRWNRIGERLARAAEAAWALAALGGARPPHERLESAWSALLAHQMHDDLTGTSIPSAYRISLDDLGFAANELSELLLDGLSRSGLAPAASGDRLLLSTVAGERRDLAELGLDADEGPRSALGPDGERLPVQIVERPGEPRRALVPLAGAGVEALLCGLSDEPAPAPGDGALEADARRLESDRYRAAFDSRGRLASLLDKRLGRDLLRAPLELELLPDRSRKYPAWEIRWEDSSAAPIATVDRLESAVVIETGPLRIALRITRRARGCRVVETWTLAAAPWGDRLECAVELDWRARGRLLKCRFPLAARDDGARYDTGLGTVRRPLASPRLYEVPAQAFAAVEDPQERFGAAILSDSRHGWDSPEPGTLRLTWIHAPSASQKFRHQASQDRGRHRFRFALLGFGAGALAGGEVAASAERFLHPWVAARATRGPAQPGEEAPGARRRALVAIETPARLLAAKPGEEGGVVVRYANPAETASSPAVRASPALGEPLDVDALERAAQSDRPADPGRLPPSGLRTLRFASPEAAPAPATRPLALPWSHRGFTRNGAAAQDGFDGRGRSFPLELTPAHLVDGPAPFDLGHLARSDSQTIVPAGQTIALGLAEVELWLLAAAIDGDRILDVELDGMRRELRVPDWRVALLRESGHEGLPFRRRVRDERFRRLPAAFSTGHLHDHAGADLPFTRGTLYALVVPLEGARSARLTAQSGVRVVAATAARQPLRLWVDGGPPLAPA